MPAFALVDFDPDGINILLTYRYGAQRGLHGRSNQVTPLLSWLGPTSHDIDNLAAENERQALLSLTSRDRGKANRMLAWPHLAENGPEAAIRRELQVMLVTGFKFEIQMLHHVAGGLLPWLEEKLVAALSNAQD